MVNLRGLVCIIMHPPVRIIGLTIRYRHTLTGLQKNPMGILKNRAQRCTLGHRISPRGQLDTGTIFCAQSNITPSVRSWPSCNDKQVNVHSIIFSLGAGKLVQYKVLLQNYGV